MREREAYGVKLLCLVLAVSEQGYYRWLKRRRVRRLKEKRKRNLLVKIRRIFFKHRRRYGSPRVCRELRKAGVRVSENRVAWMMREDGLRAKGARRFKVTTDSWRTKRIAKNVLQTQRIAQGRDRFFSQLG